MARLALIGTGVGIAETLAARRLVGDAPASGGSRQDTSLPIGIIVQ